MNLLKNTKVKNFNIDDFKCHQFGKLTEILTLGFDYLKSVGFDCDLSKIDISFIEDNCYLNNNQTRKTELRIKLNKDKPKDLFAVVDIPQLVHDQFFILNGATYVPILYITDSPILKKDNSVYLYSLFNPITIYHADNRTIFVGNDIYFTDFIRLFTDEATVLELCKKYKIPYEQNDLSNVISMFSGILKCEQDLQKIINKIDLLFLDSWTRELYKKYYKLTQVSTKLIVSQTIYYLMNDQENPSFIDLNHKRLVFFEIFFQPIIRSFSNIAIDILKGNEVKNSQLRPSALISNFNQNMQKDLLYNSTNGLSGVLSLKASFKVPKRNQRGTSQVERIVEVSNIHDTYFGRICPVTISNNDPGILVSLIPHQNVDLDFGIFC